MLPDEETFDEVVTRLCDEIKHVRPVANTPRVISIVEEMLWLIMRQQQHIETLEKNIKSAQQANIELHQRTSGLQTFGSKIP